jgi:hypothetical protein
MKNFILKAITLPLLLLLCQQLFANKIIVKGYIKYADGTVAAGRLVIVSIDSTLNPNCIQHHDDVHSDTNGYYIDTLTCNSDIEQVIISTANCNGELIINKEKVTANNVVESNFTICIPTIICNAEFDLWKDSLNPQIFYTHAGSDTS